MYIRNLLSAKVILYPYLRIDIYSFIISWCIYRTVWLEIFQCEKFQKFFFTTHFEGFIIASWARDFSRTLIFER